jgi:hypothetical protein
VLLRGIAAELIEINPLALLKDGRVVALDCKFTLDDSAIFRQSELAAVGAQEKLSILERRSAEAGLKFIELGGNHPHKWFWEKSSIRIESGNESGTEPLPTYRRQTTAISIEHLVCANLCRSVGLVYTNGELH